MPEVKPCPKCAGTMNALPEVVALPAVTGSQMMPELAEIATRHGLPVKLWVCSGCRYLELYYQPL
jgi:hypothetical protein